MSWWDLGGAADPVPQGVRPRSVDRGRRVGIVLTGAVFRMRVRGAGKLPPVGPVVVVANHTAYLDGVVLFSRLPRRVSFLIKAEAVRGPLGWLLVRVGQYAINRQTPDRRPLLDALEQLKSGGAVGVFPEGTRGRGLVESVYNGAGWLAVRSGATVVPVAIRGTARPRGTLPRLRPRVEVLVGDGFAVTNGAGRAAVAAATAHIRDSLSSLVHRLDSELAAGRRSG